MEKGLVDGDGDVLLHPHSLLLAQLLLIQADIDSQCCEEVYHLINHARRTSSSPDPNKNRDDLKRK